MGGESAILNKGVRRGRQQNKQPSAEVKKNKVLARGPLPTKMNRSASPTTVDHASAAAGGSGAAEGTAVVLQEGTADVSPTTGDHASASAGGSGAAEGTADVLQEGTADVLEEGTTADVVQCTWSFFKPCNPLLPPPVTCNKCSAPVHHLCQIIWENKHSYEPPGCAKYCPLHHAHYQELVSAGGGKKSSKESFPSSAAVATQAAKVAQKYQQSSVPLLPPIACDQWNTPAPPLFNLSRFHSSPADSTLTHAPNNHQPAPAVLTQQPAHGPSESDLASIRASLEAVPRPLESGDGGISSPMETEQGKGPPEVDDVDFGIVGINDEVIDEILFDHNHQPEDEYVSERDPEEVEHDEYGGGIVMKMERRQIIILLDSHVVSLQTTRIAWMTIVGSS